MNPTAARIQTVRNPIVTIEPRRLKKASTVGEDIMMMSSVFFLLSFAFSLYLPDFVWRL
jgi:hypothetical protein